MSIATFFLSDTVPARNRFVVYRCCEFVLDLMRAGMRVTAAARNRP